MFKMQSYKFLFFKLAVCLAMFSHTSWAAYDIELANTDIAREYPGYTHIYIRNFQELREPPFNGIYTAFMLRKPDGTQDNYYARIIEDNGAVSLRFITPETCTEENVGSDDAEAELWYINERMVPVGKFCNGKTYFLQPVGVTSSRIVRAFLDKPKFQASLNKINVTFDTTGFRETLIRLGANIE